MQVNILFFSVLKDITGTESVPWTISHNTPPTIGSLLESLYERWPELKQWDESLLLAMNHEYVRRSTALVNNAEVAIMPPVQGG